MKTNRLKTFIKAATIVLCLFSINAANAQRQAQKHARRLPDKLLKLESIQDEAVIIPGSTGDNTKVSSSLKESEMAANLKWLRAKSNKAASGTDHLSFMRGPGKPKDPLPFKTWNKYY